jgi:hypothetical protein
MSYYSEQLPCGICLALGFYVRAVAIFQVMLAFSFPGNGARCPPMAAFKLRYVSAVNAVGRRDVSKHAALISLLLRITLAVEFVVKHAPDRA